MVDNVPIAPTPASVPATAPTEAVQPISVIAAPVVAPAVEVAPAPVVAPPTSVGEVPVAPVASKPETILGETPKPIEAPKAVEAIVEAKVEQKTSEGQSAEPAPPPVYDPFTLPEGVTLDKERVGKFTEILSELETGGKVDHSLVQKFGQKAVDFHIAEVTKAQQALTDLYVKTWNKQKLDWKDTFLKDPEIGGNRFQTTVDSANNFIRTHGGTQEQQTEFRNLMETSGLGNHPAVIRLLANAGSTMAEGKPLAASKPVPAPKSKISTMYGGMT